MQPTTLSLTQLIDSAAEMCGGLNKLARTIGTTGPTLVQMKQGKRPANWRVRGKLRAVLGEYPAHAFMAAMAEDLESSEREDEKKAAEGFKTLLAAIPDDWRKRMKPSYTFIRFRSATDLVARYTARLIADSLAPYLVASAR